LLATGIRIALLRLRPWYDAPGADRLKEQSARALQQLTARAAQGSLT